MLRKHRATILSWVAALAFSALSGNAQEAISLNAPVENFKTPLFNEDGYRSWHLKADQAIYQNETEVKILGLYARQFSGDEKNEVISTLETPEGTYDLNNNLAHGAGIITVKSDQFQLTGQAWIWQTQKNTVTIHKDAKIKIFAEIGNILK
ncbi:hypothetical protein MLD52_18390 [Puniceicoccaceae bacterium K14]|nr:hypothetical protein [Puniceicoccaceae bacterium K14]